MGEVPRARHARERAVEVPGEPVERATQLVDVTGLGAQLCAPVQARVVEGADLVGGAAHHDRATCPARRRRRCRRRRGSAPHDTPSATPGATPCRPRGRGRPGSCTRSRGTDDVPGAASPTARRTAGTGRVSWSSSSCMRRAPWAQARRPSSDSPCAAHGSPAAASPARKPNTSAGPSVAPPAAVAVPKGLAAALPAA